MYSESIRRSNTIRKVRVKKVIDRFELPGNGASLRLVTEMMKAAHTPIPRENINERGI
jgi:hypothetical protein